jgi:cation transport regulator ChaC
VGTDQVPDSEPAEPTAPALSKGGESVSPDEASGEFIWLFEYGLEMDASLLNDRERLNGSAYPYGPAMLKGYQIAFNVIGSQTGQVVATILPSSQYDAVVWGMLYRVPRRLTESPADEPPPLDKAHSATYFEPVEVVVYEPHRKRELTCITYIASAAARRQFHLLPPEQQVVDASYVRHLLTIAGQHKLPQEYIQELIVRSISKKETQPAPLEQNTEPLAVVPGKANPQQSAKTIQSTSYLVHQNRWLIVFALYLLVVLLAVFTLAVLQGLNNNILTTRFTPLGIPWMVPLFGLLGGCVSSMVMLGRQHTINLPGFVLVTWFSRPYIGAILAVLAYLLLNSGIFALAAGTRQYDTLFSLVSALVGMCEGWIFYRRA